MNDIDSNNLRTFGSNVFSTLKFMIFEDVSLTKVIIFYVIKNMDT
jgi:hypothetical protein